MDFDLLIFRFVFQNNVQIYVSSAIGVERVVMCMGEGFGFRASGLGVALQVQGFGIMDSGSEKLRIAKFTGGGFFSTLFLAFEGCGAHRGITLRLLHP